MRAPLPPLALLLAALLLAQHSAAAGSCSKELEARLARMEAQIAAIHAAVVADEGQTAAASAAAPEAAARAAQGKDAGAGRERESPHAALAAEIGGQWLEGEPGESTLHFMFGLWDGDASPLPKTFKGACGRPWGAGLCPALALPAACLGPSAGVRCRRPCLHCKRAWCTALPLPSPLPHSLDTMKAWARLNPSYTLKLWSAAEVKVGRRVPWPPPSTVPPHLCTCLTPAPPHHADPTPTLYPRLKALWMEHFPQYSQLWDKCMPIQRADIGRLMILLVHGGVYADLDTRPGRPLDVMLDAAGFRRYSHNAVICIEDEKTPEMMASTARWPIRRAMAKVSTMVKEKGACQAVAATMPSRRGRHHAITPCRVADLPLHPRVSQNSTSASPTTFSGLPRNPRT